MMARWSEPVIQIDGQTVGIVLVLTPPIVDYILIYLSVKVHLKSLLQASIQTRYVYWGW